MMTPLPTPCSNCHINQLRCNTTSHVKGSCVQCYVNGLECLFPPPTIPHQGVLSNGNSPFQRNCVPCSQRHRKCIFDNNHSSQCQRCIKFGLLCLFQLSSQGRRNDLCVETIVETTATAAMEVSCLESKTTRASTSPTNDLCVESIAETTATAATEVSCLESRASTSPTNDLRVESIVEETTATGVEDEEGIDVVNDGCKSYHGCNGFINCAA